MSTKKVDLPRFHFFFVHVNSLDQREQAKSKRIDMEHTRQIGKAEKLFHYTHHTDELAEN